MPTETTTAATTRTTPKETAQPTEVEVRLVEARAKSQEAEAAKLEAQARKEEAKVATAETRRYGRQSKVASFLGSPEGIRIYRRLQSGHEEWIADYKLREVEPAGSMKNFIIQFVRPTYGGGAYEVKYVDKAGNESETSFERVLIAGPAITPAGTSAAGAVGVKDVLEAQRQARQEERDQQDRVEKLREKIQAMGGNDAMMGVVLEAMRESNTSKDKMVERLMDRQRSLSDRPLPPPPPDAVTPLVGVFDKMIDRFAPPNRRDERGGFEDKVIEFLKQDRDRHLEEEKLRRQMEMDRLKWEAEQRDLERKHQLELDKLRNKPEEDPIEKTARMIEAIDKIRPKEEKAGAAEIILALFEKGPEMISAVGEAIAQNKAAKDGNEQAKALPTGKQPAFPDSINPHCAEMKAGVESGDDSRTVKGVLSALDSIKTDKRWATAVRGLAARVANKDQQGTFRDLEIFLNRLIDSEKIDEQTARMVMATLVENWETIITALGSAAEQVAKEGKVT